MKNLSKMLEKMVESLHTAAIKVATERPEEMLRPFVFVITEDAMDYMDEKAGKYNTPHLIDVADQWDEGCFDFMRSLGERYGKNQINVYGLVVISEAWMAPDTGNEEGFLMPSEREDREEVIMTIGQDIHGNKVQVTTPFELKGGEFVAGESITTTGDNIYSHIAGVFLQGFAESYLESEHPDSKFRLGRIVATPGILNLFDSEEAKIAEFLARHSTGDWGEVPPEDAEENDYSVDKRLRILSAYKYEGRKFWIITEADRSVTTVLLPEEY